MVRDIRVKEVRFPSQTIANGSVITPVYSSEVVNGDILAISMKAVTSAGSFFFFQSGTNVELSRHTSITSGTASFFWQPRMEISSTTSGPALAGSNVWAPIPVNAPIYYLASGVSGARTLGEITVYYR